MNKLLRQDLASKNRKGLRSLVARWDLKMEKNHPAVTQNLTLSHCLTTLDNDPPSEMPPSQQTSPFCRTVPIRPGIEKRSASTPKTRSGRQNQPVTRMRTLSGKLRER